MKILVTKEQLEIIRENDSKEFNCDKCNHSWKIEKKDKHPYLCHMCGYDSHKKNHNYNELENFWKNYKKEGEVTEKWSEKYKKSINCNNPKGFSQRAHCQGRKKRLKESKNIEEIPEENKKLLSRLIELATPEIKNILNDKNITITYEIEPHRYSVLDFYTIITTLNILDKNGNTIKLSLTEGEDIIDILFDYLSYMGEDQKTETYDYSFDFKKERKKRLKEESQKEELFKEVIEKDVNEYASNYEWCDGIEISVRETSWLKDKQKPVYEYGIKFKDYSRVSYKEQENLFDDIIFVHTMYFPVENDNVDCYMSVKSVFPNGVTRSFPNIIYYDEIISEAIYSEDDLKKYGYDIEKVKQALQMLSQVSETVGEFVPLEFKLYGYHLRTQSFGKCLDLYIDVDKDDDVYNTMSKNWHDISNQLLEIFEMLGIRDERYFRPAYDFKFNKRPLFNITTV